MTGADRRDRPHYIASHVYVDVIRGNYQSKRRRDRARIRYKAIEKAASGI